MPTPLPPAGIPTARSGVAGEPSANGSGAVPRSRHRRRASVALVIGALGLGTVAACTPATPKPATPTFATSAGIEPTSYEAAATPCDPADSYDKPGPTALRALLNATYGPIDAGITRACDGSVSEHAEGRALDWMADYADPAKRVKALAVIDWLRATDTAGNTNAVARRLGLEYWIYNKQMYGSWNNFNPTPYSCAGDATSCHVNHIHFSFTWAGAYKQVSFWRGSTLPTVPTTGGSSFVVDSRSPAPALSPTQLAAGRTYTLEVSGTYRFGPVSGQTADAECSISGLTWVAPRSAAPYGSSVLDLKIGGGSIGGTTWTPVTDTGGGCNTRDHRYRMTVRPRSAMPITGLILDGRTDNSGALTVKILPAS